MVFAQRLMCGWNKHWINIIENGTKPGSNTRSTFMLINVRWPPFLLAQVFKWIGRVIKFNRPDDSVKYLSAKITWRNLWFIFYMHINTLVSLAEQGKWQTEEDGRILCSKKDERNEGNLEFVLVVFLHSYCLIHLVNNFFFILIIF